MLENFPKIIKQIWNRNSLVSVRKRSFSAYPLIVDLDLMDDQSRNLFYQEQVSSRVSKQMNDVVSLLTRALNIHLNVEQEFTLSSPNVFMSLETLTVKSLLGKEIQSVGNARLRLPSRGNLSLGDHQSGSLRVRSTSSSLIICLSFLVHIGTITIVWFFVVEHESVSIDFFDLAGSTRNWNSSSYRSRSSFWDCHSSRSFVDHSTDVSLQCHRSARIPFSFDRS